MVILNGPRETHGLHFIARFMATMIAGIILTEPTLSFTPNGRRIATSTELMYMPGQSNPNRPAPKPFIIERIDDVPGEGVYREIADMCIDVFFKEQLNAGPEDRVP